MLRDKRTELDAEKQKALLLRLLNEMTASRPDLYYLPTSEIARHMHAHKRNAGLNADERALLDRLSQRDIEVLLSLH